MYSGQGNYTPQFRQGPPGPPPPYQQPIPGPPRFVQAPPGPSLPPAPPGPQVHQLGQQAAPFFGQLPVPLAHQPIRFPPPPTSSSQYCQQLSVPPPPPPLQANVSVPVGSQFSMAGFSAPIPLPNSNVHLGMQPPPPPRILPPAPQFISQPQGQVLYHNSHPPRPGMLHAPPHPPWPSNGPILPPSLPPPSFDSAIPAQFTGQHIAGDAHPPSIPPPPSPPPPPPPSSPPPIPPSPPTPIPASETFPNDSLEVVPTTSKNNSREFDKAHAHLCDGSKGLINGNKDFMVDGKASENHALSPPRPEEVVVRNMEVLCQFIAKVGPDFENIARAKEAGNPKFDFLFGGEPGSAAAIAHEYFQWMKMKYIAERKPPKGLVTADTSSKRGHFERLNSAHSPATSDMDMEDDISPEGIDKGFSYTNKQSSSANAHSIKVQLHNEIHFASGTSSPMTSLMDADDEKDSSVFEDVSPDRGLPDPVALGDRTHEPSTISSKASNHGKFSSNNENPKSQEDLGVYLKYGSPFRLIQGYASDESDNENLRNCNDEISNAARTPVITAGTSSLQQEKQPQSSCLNFDTQYLSTVGIESMAQHSPSRLQGTVRYPNKTVPSTNNSDIMRKDLDPDVVQVEELLKDRSEVSEPSSKYGVPERKEMDANQEIEKFHSNECLPEKNDLHIVDEFGRLVREGASGSDSDGSQYIERHAKRDRSRSMSRSPQGSRWRHRSRSPRKRDRRSRSRSWSPKRGRSRSPQPFRSNMPARRGRNLPPDCFNFVRGRCFYGASCRFLHRDSGPMNMQHRYQDSRKPRYLDRFDDLSLSRIRHHDKAGAAEFHAEKRHKLSEADDILIRTSFGKFSDGKDERIPTLEAENASIPGSQEMIPETEDTNNLVNMQHRYQDIQKSRYLDRFDDLPLSRVSHQNMPGVVELHAEKPYKLAEEDDIITKTSFGKFSDGKDGPLPTPEAEDTSNLRFQGMIPEVEDTNNMRNMQHHYQDLPKHRYLDRFDDVPLSRISQHDMAGVAELHAEKPDKLAEADDIVAKTSFNKFSDGKDGLTPTLEAENASNLVYQGLIPDTEVTKMALSQDMAPGAEDSSSPAVQKMTIEEDTNNLVTQEMTPDAEDNINPVSREMTPEAEDTNNGVFQEMIPEAEDAVNRLSPEMESEPEGASNLASQERILDAEDDINQEVVRLELEPPVGNGLFACVYDVTIQPVAETSEPLHTDSYSVRSPPKKNESSPHHTDFEQPSLDDTFSSQPQLNTFASTSFTEKSKEHSLPSQISQSAIVPVQATSSQTNVGVNVEFEETANQITCSQIIASIEPSVQAFHQEISSHNILISGSNFPSPPRLSLPPPPPHGHHASPFLPPPPQQIQHMMRTPNDSSNSQPSSQQFREDIALPMTSYQSQSLPPPYMFYPQRSSLPSNLPPQPNLPWSDQHMLPALSRPPFPSSEASQLHHQHNFIPPRNDFTPLARPYPPSEVLGSRPSDFYPQAFHSVPSVNPRPLQSFPNGHGGMPIHNQGLVASSTSIPLLRPFQGDHLDPRSYPGEVSTSHLREINQPLHIQQNPSSFSTAGMMHHSMQRYTDNNFQIRPSDVSVPRFPIREHYNPYASTFEQPLRGDPGFPGLPISRFDSSQRVGDIPTVGIGFERSLSEQSLPKPRSYMHETSVEKFPDVKKQLVQEPMASAQYDPLFDSIEPSPNASKVRVEEQNSGINDTGSASKRRATKAGSKKNKGGLAPEPKTEVDELGEVATDADAGGVENESPQLVDDKDWSPLLPFDVGEANVGEIEINQIRSPSKSKKSKDSRSVKLFKVAVADFAKEVLKPSWRQGNLSKEAFKTIVKKTVDKVAGAVPSYQVPKSQAKINQYMETSQRKLTKLVLGYVDKYVKI